MLFALFCWFGVVCVGVVPVVCVGGCFGGYLVVCGFDLFVCGV